MVQSLPQAPPYLIPKIYNVIIEPLYSNKYLRFLGINRSLILRGQLHCIITTYIIVAYWRV